MKRLLALITCSVAVAACPAIADPGGPVLLGANYTCVTVPGIPCPPTAMEIIVHFDEPVDPVSAGDPDSYAFHPVDDPDGLIPVAEVTGVWDEDVYLFLTDLPDWLDYLLTVTNVEDLDGNPMIAQSAVVEPMPFTDAVPDVTAPVLLPNVPNPFNPVTEIRFALPEDWNATPVDLLIHDPAGRLVRRLAVSAPSGPGLHAVAWDGRDERGRTVPSGTYLVRLSAGEVTAMQKIMLAK